MEEYDGAVAVDEVEWNFIPQHILSSSFAKIER
jgi:hypothetical protein